MSLSNGPERESAREEFKLLRHFTLITLTNVSIHFTHREFVVENNKH